MTKAIIFDCFGVLTTDGWLPFKRKHFSEGTKLEAEVTDLGSQRDYGLINYDDFIATTAKLAKVPNEEVRKAIQGSVSNNDLFAYIARVLKPQYKLGLLSNAGANMLSELFSAEQAGLFDSVALSYETGFVKPDSRAYQAIAKRLGVEPSECVFVDDQERYCTAAREQGMKAVWYKDFEQFKEDLQILLAEA